MVSRKPLSNKMLKEIGVAKKYTKNKCIPDILYLASHVKTKTDDFLIKLSI